MLERQLGELLALIQEEVRIQRSEQISRQLPPSTLPGPHSMLPREEAWNHLVASCRGGYTFDELVDMEDVSALRTVASSAGLGSKADLTMIEAQWVWQRQQRMSTRNGLVSHARPFRVEPLQRSPRRSNTVRSTTGSRRNPNYVESSEITPRKALLIRPANASHCDPNEAAARTLTPRSHRKVALVHPPTREWSTPKIRVRGEYVPPEPHPVGVRKVNTQADTWLY